MPSTKHRRSRDGGPTLALVLAGILTVLTAWLAATTTTSAAPPPRVVATTAPAPAPSPTGCVALSYQGQWYCAGSLSKLKAGSYPRGERIVLRGMSVMSRTSTTVTIAALEAQPCPPDRWCGATLQYYSLSVAWTGTARPAYGAVIDLYGTSTGVSLTPAGYLPNTTTCHVDWC